MGRRRGLQPLARRMLTTAAMLGALGSSACATLPDAKQELAALPPQDVRLESARGPLGEQRSAAIIARLDTGSDDAEILKRHLAYEEAVNSKSPLVLGNKVTLLENGPETYRAMFAAIDDARHHVNLQTFIFDADEEGDKFAALLLRKRAQGVQVNVLYDAIGGLTTPREFFDRLRDGGVRVVEFNPVNPLAKNTRPWDVNHRDHRKLLVVDGRTAFTGGINISSTYSSSPRGSSGLSGSGSSAPRPFGPQPRDEGWRDTHVQIDGPVVAEFQKLFVDSWTRQGGPRLESAHYFPKLQRQGDEIVRAIGSSPDDGEALIYLTLISALNHAERRIDLTIAYFGPDEQLRDALTGAARRGVKVRLVLPSYTDSWAVFHLGRSHYSELLKAGVEIHERRGTVMHAKTACIDGVWCTVGSTNLDWRSFLHNDEINAVILSRGFATQMDALFADDLRQSAQISLAQWRERSWLDRIKERSARVGAYWL